MRRSMPCSQALRPSGARYIEPSTQPSHTRLESSPLFYVHKGECDRTYGRYIAQFCRPDDGWVNTWNDIREVIKQLTHTVTEPLENDPELATGNVVYYPPARIVGPAAQRIRDHTALAGREPGPIILTPQRTAPRSRPPHRISAPKPTKSEQRRRTARQQQAEELRRTDPPNREQDKWRAPRSCLPKIA